MIGPFALPSVALAVAGLLLLIFGLAVGGNVVAGVMGVVALALATAIQVVIVRAGR